MKLLVLTLVSLSSLYGSEILLKDRRVKQVGDFKSKDPIQEISSKYGELEVMQVYSQEYVSKNFYISSETYCLGEGFGRICSKMNYDIKTNLKYTKMNQIYNKMRRCPEESRECNQGTLSLDRTHWGKYFFYHSNGEIKKAVCTTPDVNPKIDEEYDCGIETRYNPDGSVKEVIDHKRKCSYGCGEFTPYLVEKIGRYKVEHPAIKIFKEPNKDSEVIGYLKKGEFFIVLEDTKKLEWIGENIAPFGKIEFGGTWYGSKKTGYIYGSGSFISGPYELEK
ncbi:MAG: SH3 domain-containing protein [Leptospiraceae bacterium]|nr:SH3 domain-containing protein [Leptospiraceae bacterium]